MKFSSLFLKPFFIPLFIFTITPAQAIHFKSKTEAFSYCLHKFAKGVKKTLGDGTTWGAGALACSVNSWNDQIYKIQGAVVIGGTFGSIIKNTWPQDEYKELNSTLPGSVVKTALDCPFAAMWLVSNLFFMSQEGMKMDSVIGFFVAGYLGWNWIDNYYFNKRESSHKKELYV